MQTPTLPKSEVDEVRRLAVAIRDLKESNYDAITWEQAICQVVRERTASEDAFFRKTALLDFFLNEEQQLSSLGIFLESLDDNILNRRQRESNYSITEEERLEIRQKVELRLVALGRPSDERTAFEYYQLLIDKAFTSSTVADVFSSLVDLAAILREFFPQAYPEAFMLAAQASKMDALLHATKSGRTKKQIAEEVNIDGDTAGLLLSRLSQIGVFAVTKRGRQNEYHFRQTTVDVNALRGEWAWLWSLPYKTLSFWLYR